MSDLFESNPLHSEDIYAGDDRPGERESLKLNALPREMIEAVAATAIGFSTAFEALAAHRMEWCADAAEYARFEAFVKAVNDLRGHHEAG